MIDFAGVVELLDDAVGGPTAQIGAHGPFWRGLTRDQFINKSVFGQKLIELGNSSNSSLIKALKGAAPFDGSVFRRMPAGRPPVPAERIAEIAAWIDAGAPEQVADSESAPPAAGRAGHSAAERARDLLKETRTTYRIHPAIGVARLGTSRSSFFIGPEAAGRPPIEPGESYRDGDFIKRQGARFRVYEHTFNMSGGLVSVREITAAEAEITWSVHLANRKAEGRPFPPWTALGPRRNNAEGDRSKLVISPGHALSVQGSEKGPEVVAGRFYDQEVILGDIRTDPQGRLIVLGGFGDAGTGGPFADPISNFANNDGWYDDTSDGRVSATITFPGHSPIEADSAWVIVAPPSFAPGIHHVTTLYDQALNAAWRTNPSVAVHLMNVSFTRDVYPILRRTALLQWVSARARLGHGPNGAINFLDPTLLDRLSKKANNDDRNRVFRRLTRFDGSGGGGMPALQSGLDPENATVDGLRVRPALTEFQHTQMQDWALGDFAEDWTGVPPAPPRFDDIPVAEQPEALDRAPLDACIGAPFFPGIEAGYIMAQVATYRAPFRHREDMLPGQLTAGNAVPWQADFLECAKFWWPAQRPTSVFREADPDSPADWLPLAWSNSVPPRYDLIMANWDRFGFVVQEGERYLEKHRLDLVETADLVS